MIPFTAEAVGRALVAVEKVKGFDVQVNEPFLPIGEPQISRESPLVLDIRIDAKGGLSLGSLVSPGSQTPQAPRWQSSQY
jgi:hypothetical protein